MNRLQSFESFVVSVDAGSLSAAAERLGTTKSNVSRRIAELEAHLGVRLLNRNPRKLSATPAGTELYQQLVSLLEGLKEIEERVGAQGTTPRGVLRIAAPMSFTTLYLKSLVVGLMKQHPDLVIQLDCDDRISDLQTQGQDCAIRFGQLRDSSLIARKFAPNHHLICASPGFSGAGLHVSRQNKTAVAGSSALALKVTPAFDGFFFIDLNADKTDYLKQQCKGRSNVNIYTGDSNTHLLNDVLPKIKYELYTRALCLLDPYGMHLDWRVIKQAGQSRAIDMFLNFPIMDINRNALLRKPDGVKPEERDRMNRLWGDTSWRDIAYVESRQTNLFGDGVSRSSGLTISRNTLLATCA